MTMINWANIEREHSNFKNRTPTKWAFIEEFLDNDFYEELYNTYPKWDDTWYIQKAEKEVLKSKPDSEEAGEVGRLSYRKFWKRGDRLFFTDGTSREHILIQENDSRYSKSWNEFMKILWSQEFSKKLSEITGIEELNLKHMNFMYARKNGFQNTHIHNSSSKTVIIFVYFSKNWSKGDPGGTFLSDGLDFDAEGKRSGNSKLIFEPHSLDNTSLIVLDGPYAAHGMRKITKDVERRGIQLTYEPFDTVKGWYGDQNKSFFEPIDI